MKKETDIEMLKRIVGNQSAMLHNLKEKIQSLKSLSNLDSEPIQAWEVLGSLFEWAEECDSLHIEAAKEHTREEKEFTASEYDKCFGTASRSDEL